MFSAVIVLWTFSRGGELGRRTTTDEIPLDYDHSFPFAAQGIPVAKDGYGVYVEGGQFVNKPIDNFQLEVPPYQPREGSRSPAIDIKPRGNKPIDSYS